VVLRYLRSKELLLRWMEMSAFSDAIFRTHPGNLPSESTQWNSDESTLKHLAAFASVHKALSPYRRHLMHEAEHKGWPLIRHLYLHYPQDSKARQQQDEFLLGRDLLVAPVLAPNVSSIAVYLPPEAHGWTHAWTGQRLSGGQQVKVPAPLGQPGLFYRTASSHGRKAADAAVNAARS